MAEKYDHKLRLQVEKMIYDTYSAVDKTGANTEYWKEKLSTMSDAEFYKFMKRRLPFRYHLSTFKNEPRMSDILDGFKVIDTPLLEKVNLPYLYRNEDGIPVQSQEAMILYLNVPRMKQMMLKKTSFAIDTSNRNMAGMLMGHDKGGKMSDREFQSLAATDLNNTIYEFSGPRADAMKAKQVMNNVIAQKGFVSIEDVPKDKEDSLAKNMMNAWMIGCNIMTNLVCTDYETPRAIERRKQRGIERV